MNKKNSKTILVLIVQNFTLKTLSNWDNWTKNTKLVKFPKRIEKMNKLFSFLEFKNIFGKYAYKLIFICPKMSQTK